MFDKDNQLLWLLGTAQALNNPEFLEMMSPDEKKAVLEAMKACVMDGACRCLNILENPYDFANDSSKFYTKEDFPFRPGNAR